jgi:hypothetical protein
MKDSNLTQNGMPRVRSELVLSDIFKNDLDEEFFSNAVENLKKNQYLYYNIQKIAEHSNNPSEAVRCAAMVYQVLDDALPITLDLPSAYSHTGMRWVFEGKSLDDVLSETLTRMTRQNPGIPLLLTKHFDEVEDDFVWAAGTLCYALIEEMLNIKSKEFQAENK